MENGMVGYRFNTIGVSDGISMGTPGMRYSLQSRDIIADSIETTMSAQWYDGLVALPGCDKNMPGCVMAPWDASTVPPLWCTAAPSGLGSNPPRAMPSTLSRPFNRTVNTSTTKSLKTNARKLSNTRAPDRGPAVACTRPTPWPPPLKPSVRPSLALFFIVVVVVVVAYCSSSSSVYTMFANIVCACCVCVLFHVSDVGCFFQKERHVVAVFVVLPGRFVGKARGMPSSRRGHSTVARDG